MQIRKLGKLVPGPLQPLAKKAWVALIVRINPNPILILGNQKSGTSAIAALLAEMTGLSVTIDLKNEIDYPTYDRVFRDELSFSELVNHNKLDFSKDIIKDCDLILLYPKLAEYFPESKFVFILRDPRDNIRSILNRVKLPGNLSRVDEFQWAKIPPAWKLILDCRWLGLEGENYIELLAARWNLMADIFLKNRNRMRLVCYEDFLKDKIGKIARLAQDLELKQVNDIADKVDIPFQPPGNRNVKWIEFFGHDNLARIDRICCQNMKQLGYFPSNQVQPP
jgi:hypothetical protein